MALPFCGIEVHTSFLQYFQDVVDVDRMFLEVVRGDQDVIYVGSDKVLKELAAGVVDEVLEGGRGVCAAKGPHIALVGSIQGSECCFPIFSFCDADLMVS